MTKPTNDDTLRDEIGANKMKCDHSAYTIIGGAKKCAEPDCLMFLRTCGPIRIADAILAVIQKHGEPHDDHVKAVMDKLWAEDSENGYRMQRGSITEDDVRLILRAAVPIHNDVPREPEGKP